MSIRQYVGKTFEVVLVPGATNQILLFVDWLDSNQQVVGPLDGSIYSSFACQASAVPTKETPRPTPVLNFTAINVPGVIPEGDVEVHPGAFLLQLDPTESAKIQDSWIKHGIIDLFGTTNAGQRDYLALGNFTTSMAATRDFV